MIFCASTDNVSTIHTSTLEIQTTDIRWSETLEEEFRDFQCKIPYSQHKFRSPQSSLWIGIIMNILRVIGFRFWSRPVQKTVEEGSVFHWQAWVSQWYHTILVLSSMHDWRNTDLLVQCRSFHADSCARRFWFQRAVDKRCALSEIERPDRIRHGLGRPQPKVMSVPPPPPPTVLRLTTIDKMTHTRIRRNLQYKKHSASRCSDERVTHWNGFNCGHPYMLPAESIVEVSFHSSKTFSPEVRPDCICVWH